MKWIDDSLESAALSIEDDIVLQTLKEYFKGQGISDDQWNGIVQSQTSNTEQCYLVRWARHIAIFDDCLNEVQ